MASANATANTVAQALFSVPLHKKGIADGIDVNNQGTSGPITFTLQDVFSQDLSHGNSAVTSRTATPWNITVAQGSFASIDRNSLKGLSFIGAAKAIANVVESGATLVIRFHYE